MVLIWGRQCRRWDSGCHVGSESRMVSVLHSNKWQLLSSGDVVDGVCSEPWGCLTSCIWAGFYSLHLAKLSRETTIVIA